MVTLAIPLAAEARVSQTDSSQLGQQCGEIQQDWDNVLFSARKHWRPATGGGREYDERYANALHNIQAKWYNLGCGFPYGSIVELSQWLQPSEWAVNAFGANHTLVGDFNGDGRADVSVFSQGSEYPMPSSPSVMRYDLHTANRKPAPGPGGNGDFVASKVTSAALQEFRGWATNPGAKLLAGDFNGDKRADYLDIDPSSGSMAVAFSLGGANFQAPVVSLSSFASLADEATSKVVVGDFNGDGKDDVAAVGKAGWTGVKVASASGTGTFDVTTAEPGDRFMAWAADPDAKVVAGDFNGDAKDDLLLYGSKCWTQESGSCSNVIPIAYATASGFTAEQHQFVTGYNTAAANADGGAAKVVVGDYNDDDNDELVIFSSVKHPTQADTYLNDVRFIQLSGTSALNQQTLSSTISLLLPKVIVPGATPVAGDFDRDGKDDIAVAGRFDDNRMSVMFYKSAGQTVFTDSVVTSPTCAPLACGGTNQ
ncbi:FG-GAP repeat domain-containing protein [Streptomyces sp. 1222.5]|uniref:FG-GAP repeat domain-containing protein n=1 Tax=Streptomyces sp. 1222.5 TaxID=1881026 RepID=UPI003EB8BBA3